MNTIKVKLEDLDIAVTEVLRNSKGIKNLYQGQYELLQYLFGDENIFYTSSTNSGKTLPGVIFPEVMKKLNNMGYSFTQTPRVLFLTELNSIQMSLVVNMRMIGIVCDVISKNNVRNLLTSDISVLFVSPEVLKNSEVTQALLQYRSNFVLKIVDEAHLGIRVAISIMNREM